MCGHGKGTQREAVSVFSPSFPCQTQVAVPILFPFAPLRVPPQPGRWGELSPSGPFVRTTSPFSWRGLAHRWTEVSSASFSAENGQAGGLVRLLAN